MYILVSYRAGSLDISQYPEYLQAKEQMDTEFDEATGGELEGVAPISTQRDDFAASVEFGDTGHWIWQIEELD